MAETSPEPIVTGSCLCGEVAFEVTLPTSVCAHCHCSQCRRAHGAAFVTWFTLPRSQWRMTAGSDQLRRYRSSEHATRSFCGRCGSSLFFETERDPDRVDIVLANLHADLDRPPQLHIHVDDRVPWVELADSLPRVGGDPGLGGEGGKELD